jgi:SAM-dependent methyltransferase
MFQTTILPSLATIPENMDEQLRQLIQQPYDPAIGDWLYELLRASGHLSTPDHLRWRVVCMVWLAAQYSMEQAWPYLMWLNQNQPVIGEHLADILSEGANDLDSHIQLANWVAQAQDERLKTFMSEYRHVPPRYVMPDIVRKLLAQPTAPETGVWLAAYCRDTAGNIIVPLHPWRLLTTAWYATYFNPTTGLTYLQELSGGEPTLSAVDNKILTDLANELNCLAQLWQWRVACPNEAVKTMLKDIGHPNLAAFSAAIFQQPPNYEHLAELTAWAAGDVQTFRQVKVFLEQDGVSPKSTHILDLACGLLAPQTLLLNSAGYKVTGADLHIPPAFLPLPGLKQWFGRGKYVKAWQEATNGYYQLLSQHSGLKLKWNGAKIVLADITRLEFSNQSFKAVICVNRLQHVPDVDDLLAEVARVLKPGGIFIADIVPYPALNGAFLADEAQPWLHLRHPAEALFNPGLILNQWREGQYRAAFEKFFRIEQWQVRQDQHALTMLTPAIWAELAGFTELELTCEQVVIVAKKL